MKCKGYIKQLFIFFLRKIPFYSNKLPLFIKFEKLNRNFIKTNFFINAKTQNNIILIENFDNIYMLLGLSLVASVIAKVKKSKVIIFSEKSTNLSWVKNSFYQNNYLHPKYYSICKEEVEKDSNEIFCNLKSINNIKYISYHDIEIGDLIYDDTMRHGRWQATVHKLDDRLFLVIKKYIKIIKTLDKISSDYDVKACLFSHTIGIGGLVLRYFLNRGVESYSGLIGPIPIVKVVDGDLSKITFDYAVKNKLYKGIINDEKLKNRYLKEADDYLLNRINGKETDFDSKKAFNTNKTLYTDTNNFCSIFNLDPKKPCVFIMLHAFNDFPNYYKNNIFRDYYHWFIDTLKIIKQIDHINWIIKEHPSADFYPDDANICGLIEIIDKQNIILIRQEDNFNSASLQYIAHSIVTCTGTAGLEFTCFGVPAIIASPNHYSGLGLIHEAANIENYEYLIENIDNKQIVQIPSIEIQNKAKILFYLFYNFCFNNTNENYRFISGGSHEVRINNNLNEVLNFYIDELLNDESLEYLEKLKHFIAYNGNASFFYNDDLMELIYN